MKLKSFKISSPAAILIGSVVIAIAILVTGGTITLPTTQVQEPKPENNLTVIPLSDQDHVRGSRNARILLIEYSDFECPFCKNFHSTAKQTVENYNNEVAWVFRHFPLDQIHSKARKEAEAVECAFGLGGEETFWKMADKIFEITPGNNGLDLDTLPTLASQIGLNQNQFKNCLESGKYAPRVESDYQNGVKDGVQGTPGNFLLDTKTGKVEALPGAVPFGTIKTSIDDLLKS